MKKVNNRKEQPTEQEKELAMEMQTPGNKLSSFQNLAKHSRSPRMTLGGNAQWIKADMLFRDDYHDGLESPPFIITRAFKYVSKTLGDRFGLEITLPNGHFYNVGFPFNEGDSKRVQILDMFSERNAEPFGPVCLRRLDLGKGNDYYDIVPYGQENASDPGVDIPFQEVKFDPEIPF